MANRVRNFMVFLIISCAAVLLVAAVPVFTFFWAIIWGAIFILSALYIEKKQLFVVFILNILILYLTVGIADLAFFMATVGAAVLVMAYMTKEHKGYYKIQKYGFFTVALSVSLFLGFLYLSSGDIGIKDVENDFKVYLEKSLRTYEESGFFDLYEKEGITREKIEKDFLKISKEVARHLPAFYFLQAIMVVFFSLLLASLTSMKRGMEGLEKKPFAEEIMPWQLVWLVILGLIMILTGEKDGSTAYLYYAGSNVLAVMFPITIYYGTAALAYRLQNMSASSRRWFIVFIIIMTLLFSLSVLVFLGLVGIFDSLLDYRKINKSEEDLR
ncbi:DUF2232 domain-containing protein [Thermosyntropha sp.]|uniref:DUF2232 domain-containing protein n=1 Tax=Thermosyntropha sp. TaxID=2740820 RepID=UPI0025FC35D2|nr:DUF2232 domain-containing protein [Thermosyntropha sp.]MBO8159645.1 DUF2232 domain-containing protein [Thermosyntropha sp.]